MNTQHLRNVLNEQLVAHGFKKKGNNWYTETDTIIKIINLQKSNYGKYFYINYGYIIKELDLGNLSMHIWNRYGSDVLDCLDLEKEMNDEIRVQAIQDILKNTLLPRLNTINSTNDLYPELKKRPHLNDIPLVVKQYFKLD